MTNQSKNEKKALIILFKDINNYYNANSLSKVLGISRVGCMKLLKKLHIKGLLTLKKIGKATTYKLNLENDFAIDLITFILSEEANNFRRWKEEFKELSNIDRIVLLYGSTIKDYSKARDIDIMVIREPKDSGNVNKIIINKQQLLPKKIHLIELSREEFIANIRKKQPAMMDIVKNAIILYGQSKYAELLKDVSSF